MIGALPIAAQPITASEIESPLVTFLAAWVMSRTQTLGGGTR